MGVVREVVRNVVRDPLRQGQSLPNPLCWMPLSKDLLLRLGTGSATFTRSTTGTFIDAATGLVTTASVNIPRFEANGVLIEGGSTNDALHNRDHTNAVWAKTGLTALKDAIGADGVANSASTLTATAPAGTSFQTVTQVSAENTYSIDVRRKTGTGVIEITDDNGSTLTDITASINSSTYTRFEITTTQANPVFGVKITTSGDEVEVDYGGLEELPFASSRIETTTIAVARGADDLSIDDANIPAPTADYSVSMLIDILADHSTDQHAFNATGESARSLRAVAGSAPRASHAAVVNGTALTPNTATSMVMTKDSSTLTFYQDQVSKGTATPGAITGTRTAINIGNFSSGVNELFGHVKDFRIYSSVLTATQVASL